ncbi:MAG: hypothetical protein CM1200mP22_30540 [Dehalococcoidia bacterium]|nr:MAG: hypothetical protein CM1200mP22_30540 [Dehalococcoidia bacterium]
MPVEHPEDYGREMKICSLLPSGTEILFALGLEGPKFRAFLICVTFLPELETNEWSAGAK